MDGELVVALEQVADGAEDSGLHHGGGGVQRTSGTLAAREGERQEPRRLALVRFALMKN
jgi:hypothetical protein